ncbi:MAG: glucose-6-phosphate isomerase [Rhodocyclaceae bacterium]
MVAANDWKYSGYTDVTETFTPPSQRAEWSTLRTHAARLARTPLAHLPSIEPGRSQQLCFTLQTGDASHAEHAGDCTLALDLSRQHMDSAALHALIALAQACGVPEGLRSLFDGERVNFTEGRAALHMALRNGTPPPADEREHLSATWARCQAFAQRIRAGQHPGSREKPIDRVINLGIGGSDLGPRLVSEALLNQGPEPAFDVRFVANIDPRDLDQHLLDADPATTLFIVSSKSFSTAETLANARAARQWLQAGLGDACDLGAHFAAVSNATAAAAAFGIAGEHIFALPEWVGGRYSLWSTIGLPALIAIGPQAFDDLLAGARTMDQHLQHTPLARNLPVLAALAGLWNTDFLDIENLAVLPYAHGLRSLPAWLQQLEMESNGKHCLRDGSRTAVPTAPIVWGGAEPVGQHAFHQLFFQGTRRCALDFIVPVGHEGDPRQNVLINNALAQSAALMHGRSLDEARILLARQGLDGQDIERLAPHLVCDGNQPSSLLLMDSLSPRSLGQLLAFYEHKVFVQGWVWGINSFDQFGVELGKDMARALERGETARHDESTLAQLAWVARLREQQRKRAQP